MNVTVADPAGRSYRSCV